MVAARVRSWNRSVRGTRDRPGPWVTVDGEAHEGLDRTGDCGIPLPDGRVDRVGSAPRRFRRPDGDADDPGGPEGASTGRRAARPAPPGERRAEGQGGRAVPGDPERPAG